METDSTDIKARRLLVDMLARELKRDDASEARITLLMRRINYYQRRITGVTV